MVNREKVERMSEEGMTVREIGEELGISAASVCRLLKASLAALGCCQRNAKNQHCETGTRGRLWVAHS